MKKTFLLGGCEMDYRTYGELKFEDPRDKMQVQFNQGTYYLVCSESGKKLAEVWCDVFESKFKGVYNNWIGDVIRKRLQSIDKQATRAQETLDRVEADFLFWESKHYEVI